MKGLSIFIKYYKKFIVYFKYFFISYEQISISSFDFVYPRYNCLKKLTI